MIWYVVVTGLSAGFICVVNNQLVKIKECYSQERLDEWVDIDSDFDSDAGDSYNSDVV